jgi:steroid delta-isomerase-like uncharacterized protein
MADAASVHRAMFEAVMARNLDALREIYHPDYTYEGSDGTTGDAEAGIAVAATYTAAFSDLTFEIRHQFSPSPDVSIIELTARGTHDGQLEDLPPTGRTVEILACNVVEVADGRILREREYYDTLAIMGQLGVAN